MEHARDIDGRLVADPFLLACSLAQRGPATLVNPRESLLLHCMLLVLSVCRRGRGTGLGFRETSLRGECMLYVCIVHTSTPYSVHTNTIFVATEQLQICIGHSVHGGAVERHRNESKVAAPPPPPKAPKILPVVGCRQFEKSRTIVGSVGGSWANREATDDRRSS